MADKSSTHQKVIKNSVEGWIIKEIWDKMVSKGKTNGFHAVANTPPEIEVFKRKNTEPVEVSDKEIEEVIAPELTEPVEAKEKGKPGPKPKQ